MTPDRGRPPARHVAFLRAVNVGGRGVVRMADVAAAFTAAGAAGVRTFIQSGNVLFDAPAGGLAALRPALHREMTRLLSAEPVIVFRTLRDLAALVEEAPFGRRVLDASLKLYVVFLAAAPARTPAFPLRLPREALEAIGIRGRDVLLVSRRKPERDVRLSRQLDRGRGRRRGDGAELDDGQEAGGMEPEMTAYAIADVA